MRITNNIIQRNATLSLQLNLQGMAQAQTQVSTGQRYSAFSDNPTDQSSVMQTSSALRALDQYKKNVSDATSRANTEDTVLQQLTTLVDRATEIATEEGTSTSTAATRVSAKAEVDDLLASAAALGNTKYGNDYLFGGDNVTTAPITTAAPFYSGTGVTGAHTTEISAGQLFKSNHNAKEILLDSGVMQSLQALSAALGSNNTTAIGAALTSISGAQNSVQALVGDLGARENQLDVTGSNLDALKNNLTTFKSNLSEVDQTEAMTTLVTRQTAYQAAMLSTSKVIGMTLTDYLR